MVGITSSAIILHDNWQQCKDGSILILYLHIQQDRCIDHRGATQVDLSEHCQGLRRVTTLVMTAPGIYPHKLVLIPRPGLRGDGDNAFPGLRTCL